MGKDSVTGAGFGPRWHYAVALLLGVIVVGLYVGTVMAEINPYKSPDSSSYLEAARSLLAGSDILVSAPPEKFPLVQEPITLWPPGYPALIALGAKLSGQNAYWVAPALDWISWALLPLVLLFAFRPVLRNWTIHGVSLLAMLSPGLLDSGAAALSDAPFLLLTALSLALLFRGTLISDNWKFVLLSGLAGGIAYTVRNVGVALPPALALAYLLLVLTGRMSLATALRRGLLWAAGAAIAVVPLAIHNLMVFGELQPYRMAPSDYTLVLTLHNFLIALINDLTGDQRLGRAIEWNNIFLAVMLLVMILPVLLARKYFARVWKGFTPEKRESFVVLACAALVGLAVVIVARTHYQWGEPINVRHLMQYDWMMLAGLALLLEPALCKTGRKSGPVLAAISAVALVLLGLRLLHLSTNVRYAARDAAVSRDAAKLMDTRSGEIPIFNGMQLALMHDRALLDAVKALPPDRMVISNHYEVLRVEAPRRAVEYHLGRECRLSPELVAPLRDPKVAAKSILLLFVEQGAMETDCWHSLVAHSQSEALLGLDRPYLVTLLGDAILAALGH